MLLVMSNGGYLAPPTDADDQSPEQEELWDETWKRVNRFLPNFLGELFPEEVGKPVRARKVAVREKDAEKEVAKEERDGEEEESEDEVVDGEREKVGKGE